VVELIRTTAPDVVVFGCTSAGALGTLAHDDGIGEIIKLRLFRYILFIAVVHTDIQNTSNRKIHFKWESGVIKVAASTS
jgi:hypothetical protein